MQKVIFVAIVTFFISGCSVFQRERKTIPERDSLSELSWNSIIEKNLTNNDFNIQKAEIQYIEEEKSINLVASLKYRKDEIYLVSLRSKAGIEIARIFLTQDTILVNDRINKKLYYGATDYLEEKYGISADAIPIIFGDLIVDGNKEINMECKGGTGIINGRINLKSINYRINCTKRKVSDINICSDTDERLIEIKLSNFKNIEDKIFPETIELIDADSKSEIKISIKKIEFNIEESLKFIPGTNYEKIPVR